MSRSFAKSGLSLNKRFRGFLPVIVDVETSGIDPNKNAILEMCVVLTKYNDDGLLIPTTHYFEHFLPFDGAEINAESLAFNGIDPYQPLRFAVEESIGLQQLFTPIFKEIQTQKCHRAVLVGHNAWFDLLFVKQAVARTGVKSPFHAFTCFDTATLGGLAYGQTVLAKALQAAKIPFDTNEAHSAIYDATKTAELFCNIVNQW